MRYPEYASQFKRDFKKAKSRSKNISAIRTIMELLLNDVTLPEEFKDHPLKGEWKDFRELHIEPDWLLVYQLVVNTVYFTRTGTYSDIFNE